MKDLTSQSCCSSMPNPPDTFTESGGSSRAFRYVLYLIPLLALWMLVYRELADFSRLIT
jgi:hypothetical protein